MGKEALNTLPWIVFKNPQLLRAMKRKNMLKFLVPCNLALICRSFFFFFSFPPVFCMFSWLSLIFIFLSPPFGLSCGATWYFLFPCYAVLFLPISTLSPGIGQRSNCFSLMSWMGEFFWSCLYESVLWQITFLVGVSFSDHLVLQGSTELAFSLQLLSSITSSISIRTLPLFPAGSLMWNSACQMSFCS